jgi:hypothetical protein
VSRGERVNDPTVAIRAVFVMAWMVVVFVIKKEWGE